MSSETPSSTLSRRNVAKGVAWSIPAVTIAASAPALAASCVRHDKTLNSTINITQSRTVTNENDVNVLHDSITFTNTGPDQADFLSLSARYPLIMTDSTQAHSMNATPADKVSFRFTQDETGFDNGDGTVFFQPKVSVSIRRPLAVGESMTLVFNTTIGKINEADGHHTTNNNGENVVVPNSVISFDKPSGGAVGDECGMTYRYTTLTGDGAPSTGTGG